MIDINFLRENPEIVKENIKKKFQDEKLPLVDEVIELDEKTRSAQKESDQIRAAKNKTAKANGAIMGQMKKAQKQGNDALAAELKAKFDAAIAASKQDDARLAELDEIKRKADERIRTIMLTIPNIIDP